MFESGLPDVHDAIAAPTSSIDSAVSVATDRAASARFDMYGPIHKGLRRAMGETLSQVGAMDWLDPQDVADVLGRLRALLAACESHLKHENDFVHAALDARLPGAAGRTAADHVEHVAEIRLLRRLADRLEQAPDAGQAATAARALYSELAAFVAENYLHMRVEETRNNASLWGAFTDDELLEIHDALLASIPPQEMAETARTILPALAPAERAGLMIGMRMGMPAEAFDGLLGIAREVLDERDWAKLAAALAPMAAGATQG